MKTDKWVTKSSVVDYENPFMRIVKNDVIRPNGYRSPYYVLDRSPFSIIVPLTDTQETYLVGQYRYPIQRYSWEFPMGSAGKQVQKAVAQQELREETGLTASVWQEVGTFAIAPGHNNQMATLHLAQKLVEGPKAPEQGELLEVKKVPFRQVGDLIVTGEIIDGVTICAYHLMSIYLDTKAQL